MPKFIYNKLIRDKISDLASLDGAKLDFEYIAGEALITQLTKKLGEEIEEILAAKNHEELIDELVDLQEIIDALLKNCAIDQASFDARKHAKKEKKGGFELGVYAHSMEVNPGHPRYDYFKQNPHKYPEVE